MSMTGLGNIRVDHARLLQAVKDLLEVREGIMSDFDNCRVQMQGIAGVMQSLAGRRIIERFNNLGEKYYGEYARSMVDHAEFLERAAIRYSQTDEARKEAAKSALKHFEDV